MSRLVFDPTLYLVTDPELRGGRSLMGIVEAAIRGGVTMVQLRDKQAGGRGLLEQAQAMKAQLAPAGVPLLVNDRADVAFAAGAAGCHVGQSDLPPAAVRQLLGPDAIVGLSLDDPRQAAQVNPDVVDYVAIGPFAATTTKADAGAAVGADTVAAVRARLSSPLVAIGGVAAGNAEAAIAAGADGVAVVSAIVAAGDPEAASRALREAIARGRCRRGDRRESA